MAFTKKNYVDLTGLSTFKSSLLGTVINDTNKTTTSKTATIKAIADYVDSEVGDLSSAVTEGLANKVSSVTYDSTNKKIVYNKGGSTNTDVVTVATIKSAIGNFVKSGTGASSGLVPAPSTTAGTSKYLREDGTWVTPPNTTYSVFVKSGSGAKAGLVPAPSTTAGTSKYLREDGTWTTPPDTNTTYTNATASKAGLMGADDKAKLDGIATNANNYSHPTYTSKTSGLYKITVDGTGHVSGTTAVAKSDITALGIPGSDTTYSVFGKSGSGAKSGLVPAPSTTAGTSKYLREDGTWTTPPDTNTTYSNATSSSAGLMGADDKAKLDGITASADSVSFSRSLTSGTKVGTITINNTATDLFAPTNTDTHYTAKNVVSSSNTGTGNVGEAISNPYINLIENGAVRSTHRISGSGATTVKTDASGNIIISSTDTNTTYDNATASKAGLMGADDKAKLNGIAAGAEVNQNAFSNVKIGDVTVSADSKTDTLTLVAGSNVTITPDSANDKITIASSYVNTTYSSGTDLSLSGTTFNHATSGVTAGTYRSVTVNTRGHVTGGSNPTTLSGYGITDAKIENGVITLGSNTITPLTSSSSLNASKLTGTISVDRLPATALERCVVVADDTARFKLTTSNVQVGDTVKVTATKKMYMVVNSSKLSTEAGYEEYFTSTDWSTITNKPSSYTPASHTHTKSQITDFPTSMPASDVYSWAKAKTKPSYAWNEITDKPTSFTPASHTHTKAQITDFPTSMPASDVYDWAKAKAKPSYAWSEITNKPSTFTPASHTHAKSQITDFPTSMPASDVYDWAKASNKPTYSWSEITNKPSTFTPASHTHSYAGSASAGGPANEFVVGAGSDDADRYVYFAYNSTDYNNSSLSSVSKGRAVIDSEFKYNPSTNKLSTGSIQLNSKVTLQYNSSTESLDFVFA